MNFKYQLDDRPPLAVLVALGLQWFAVSIPGFAIIGAVVGDIHGLQLGEQILYVQKTLFLSAAALAVQVLGGHRLPLVLGPSSVLLIGLIASQGFDVPTVYSSILIGGLILALVSLAGFFGRLQRLFTPRVVAVILILIALTLAPTVMGLITVAGGRASPLANLLFAMILTLFMFFLYRYLRGIWRSTLILWAMVAGTLMHVFLFPQGPVIQPFFEAKPISLFFTELTTGLSVQPGVLVSFLFCFFALSINDLGSIQSMKELLNPQDMTKRIKRGITFTGLANALSGFFGVVGPVNFSLSPGVITATGCASRYTLLPAAALLFLLSFSPLLVGLMGAIPPVVVGSCLIYILSYQVAAGLMVAFQAGDRFGLENGLVIGLPVLLATIVAFLPGPVLGSFPAVLRPVLGNGFVIGVISTIILEHVIFRK